MDIANQATGQTQDGLILAGIGGDMDLNWATDWDKYPEVSSCPNASWTDLLCPAEDVFPGISKTYGWGPTFMNIFNADIYAEKQHVNIFYPFANKDD